MAEKGESPLSLQRALVSRTGRESEEAQGDKVNWEKSVRVAK